MATLDQYTIIKTLGSGVSAKVKLAEDPQGNRYALKIFKLDNLQNNQNTMAFLRQEVESTLRFNHHHIVKYHAF